VDALKQKYASDVDFATADVKVITGPVLEKITISGKEVEEVGFEKIRRQLAQLHELRIVLLENLCLARPLPRSLRREWIDEQDDEPRTPLDVDGIINQTCPKATELDLSCNLFEDWKEIASICSELPLLTSLRLDGNRFRKLGVHDQAKNALEVIFRGIKFLGLEDTLIDWEDLCNLASRFRDLTTLSAANNALTRLSSTNLPPTLTSLNLEGNAFQALSDVTALSELPNLQKLYLKYNTIATVARHDSNILPPFSGSLTELDLSYNCIDSWALIQALPQIFPGLVSLRVSHNPLYQNLKAPDGQPLTADDGYMLTVARLPMVKTLNYSPVTPKEKLNAETYYLSLITTELTQSRHEQASAIKASHPRYQYLCNEYGDPTIKASKGAAAINANSLAARLIRLTFRLDDATTAQLSSESSRDFVVELPKRFSVYSVLGIVGKHFGLEPLKVKLIWETGEWDVVSSDTSDEDSDNDMEGRAKEELRRSPREVEIVAGTRAIETWIDGEKARLRVGLR